MAMLLFETNLSIFRIMTDIMSRKLNVGHLPSVVLGSSSHKAAVGHQRRSSSSSPAQPRSSAKATCFIVMSFGDSGLIISNMGVMPMAYTGIASLGISLSRPV